MKPRGATEIQHELLDAGASHVTSVDASPAYLAVAREEAGRRGYGDRVEYTHGDFVEKAPEVEPAQISSLSDAPDVETAETSASAPAAEVGMAHADTMAVVTTAPFADSVE